MGGVSRCFMALLAIRREHTNLSAVASLGLWGATVFQSYGHRLPLSRRLAEAPRVHDAFAADGRDAGGESIPEYP